MATEHQRLVAMLTAAEHDASMIPHVRDLTRSESQRLLMHSVGWLHALLTELAAAGGQTMADVLRDEGLRAARLAEGLE